AAQADPAATGSAGPDPDQLLVRYVDTWRALNGKAPDWSASFARSLSHAVTAAVEVAGGARMSMQHGGPRKKPWELALGWFVSSFPLLGGIASGLKVVAEVEFAQRHQIWIAAVDAALGGVYITPLAGLGDAA